MAELTDDLLGGYSEDPVVRTDPAGRVGQASQLALDADLPGAWAAMFQPEALTPPERDRLLRKHNLTGGPFDAVMRTVTNPAFLISMYLSYKFPVPTAENMFKLSRKVEGMTARFPFLGRITSAWTTMRGTNVPDTLAEIAANRKAFGEKYTVKMRDIMERFRIDTGKLPNKREGVMLASWLDGLHKPMRGFDEVGILMPDLEKAMSPQLLEVGRKTRGVLDEMWTETFADLKNRRQILKAIYRQKKAGFNDDVLDQLAGWINDPTKVPDYLPHRTLKTEEEFRSLMATLVQGTDKKEVSAKAQKKILQWLGPEFEKRKHAMMPSLQDLNEVMDVVDPGAYRRMNGVVKTNIIEGARRFGVRDTMLAKMEQMELPEMTTQYPQWMQGEEAKAFALAIAENPPKQYSLSLVPVFHNYNNTMASTFAWTIKGGGEKMMENLKVAKALAAGGDPHAKVRAEMLENTYIPMAMGRQDFKNAVRAQIWDQEMTKLAVRLDTPGFRGVLGDNLTDYLRDNLKQTRGAFSLLNLERKSAAYFYVSALGLNPASAIQNFMSMAYTGSVIGPKSTLVGGKIAMEKAKTYYGMRFKGATHLDSLREAYPEFHAAGLAPGSLIDETMENALQNAYNLQSLPAGKAVKVADRITRAAMSLFSTTEHANRLATFEGAMYHAKRTGMTDPNAMIQFGRRVVAATQFTPGIESTPYFLLDKGPLFKQFLQYPFKALEFVTRTALTLGGGAIDPKTGKEMSLMGINPGTFARLVAGSVLATELGDAIGVDFGQTTLLGGPLLASQKNIEGHPFAPIPALPPAIQLAGAAAMGVGSGDFSALLHSTPLLVPGGVAAYRAMGLLPPGVPGSAMGQAAAKWAERSYADYQAPAPDGRIGIYSGKGVLKGFYTPWEVFKQGLGIRGGGPQKEQETLETLVKNRDQIREYRRNYYDSLLTNNFRQASVIQREFQGRFGFALPVAQADLKAVQVRRKMTRLEQVLQTMPEGPARQHFGQMIGAALGAEAPGLLGVSPDLLSQPTKVREKARSSNLRPSPYLNQMGPTETVEPSQIGRQPYPQTGNFGF